MTDQSTQPGEEVDVDQEVEREEERQEGDQKGKHVERQPSPRELEMERLAQARHQQFLEDEGLNKKEEEKAPASAADPISQIGVQLEDGRFLLDESALAKMAVRRKVDGVEEVVPADQVFRQYQKGAAADLRLAEATRLQREAQEALQDAQAKARAAVEEGKSKEEQGAAQVDLEARGKELVSAMYSGDEGKSGKMLSEYVNAAVAAALAGRQSATPQVDELVQRAVTAAVPALRQQLSVEGALSRLQQDYPEIWADADHARATDWRIAELEAQGKSRPEAIALASEQVAQKFKLGKYAVRSEADPTTTARSERLARKQGLDEPEAASARATDTTPPVQTPSQIIAEMARLRGQAL